MMRRKLRVLLSILLYVIGGKGITVYGQVNAEQVTIIGRNVLANDDYMLAIHYFNQAIRAKDYLPEPYYFRALAKMYLDDFQGAETDCTKAIDIKKYFIEAYKLRGFSRLQLGKDSLALIDLNRCLLESPKDKDLLYFKSVALCKMEKWDDADTTLNGLIQANPNFYEALTVRAGLRMERGDTIGCLEDIEKTLSLSKTQLNAYALKLDIMQNRCNWPEAIECLDEIVRVYPDRADLYINRAFFKYKNDDYEGAMADYTEAIHIDPYNTTALFNRGLLRYEVLELDKAVEDFSRVLDLDSSNVHALFNRVMINLQRGNYAKAEPDIKTIIKRYPRFYPAYYALAQCRQARGDMKGAIQNMNKADELVRKYVDNPKKNPLDRPTIAPVANNKSKNMDKDTEDEMMDRFNQLVTTSIADDTELSYNDKYKGKVQDRETAITLEPMFTLSMKAPDESLKSISNYFKELADLNSNNYISEKIYLVEDQKPLTQEEVEEGCRMLDKYTAAISSSQKRAIDYLGRGVVYAMLHNYDEALKDFDRALELMPDFTVALMGKGYVMSRRKALGGDIMPAMIIGVYDRALEVDPLLVYAWFNKGNIFYEAGDFVSAEECYSKAVELYPDLGQAYYNRGLSRMQSGKKEEAFQDFSKAGERGILQGYRVMKSLQ